MNLLDGITAGTVSALHLPLVQCPWLICNVGLTSVLEIDAFAIGSVTVNDMTVGLTGLDATLSQGTCESTKLKQLFFLEYQLTFSSGNCTR